MASWHTLFIFLILAASDKASAASDSDKRIFPRLPKPPYKLSQKGQHVVLKDLFSKIGVTNKYYVEFGFNVNEQCAGSGSNTCIMWYNGWNGLLLDGTNSNSSINLHAHLLYSTNIVRLFQKYKVPMDLDYLSVDLDSADLWIVRALLLAGYRPRVMQIEFNTMIPWNLSIAFPDGATMTTPPGAMYYTRGVCYMSSSLKAYVQLAEEFQYTMCARFTSRQAAAHARPRQTK